MPVQRPDTLNDVKNWPNLIFKFVLSCLGTIIFILGTALYNEVAKLNKNLGDYREGQILDKKDQSYLKEQVLEDRTTLFKHIERAEQQDIEQDRRIDRLEYHIKSK